MVGAALGAFANLVRALVRAALGKLSEQAHPYIAMGKARGGFVTGADQSNLVEAMGAAVCDCLEVAATSGAELDGRDPVLAHGAFDSKEGGPGLILEAGRGVRVAVRHRVSSYSGEGFQLQEKKRHA